MIDEGARWREDRPIGLLTSQWTRPDGSVSFEATTAPSPLVDRLALDWSSVLRGAEWTIGVTGESLADRARGMPRALADLLFDADVGQQPPAVRWRPAPHAMVALHDHLAGVSERAATAGAEPGRAALVDDAFHEPWVVVRQSPIRGLNLGNLTTEAVVIVALGHSGDPAVIVVGAFGLVALRILYEPAGALGRRLTDRIRGKSEKA